VSAVREHLSGRGRDVDDATILEAEHMSAARRVEVFEGTATVWIGSVDPTNLYVARSVLYGPLEPLPIASLAISIGKERRWDTLVPRA
jgi:hypothetical protein